MGVVLTSAPPLADGLAKVTYDLVHSTCRRLFCPVQLGAPRFELVLLGSG